MMRATQFSPARLTKRRTGWAECLQGVDPSQVVDIIKAPAEDAEGVEAVEYTICITLFTIWMVQALAIRLTKHTWITGWACVT
jgi:Flp pilus assembly pilin Flp